MADIDPKSTQFVDEGLQGSENSENGENHGPLVASRNWTAEEEAKAKRKCVTAQSHG